MKENAKVVMFSVVLLLVAAVQAGRLCGLERMERLDLLPCFLEGTQVRQVSSHDRNGGNDDGFNGTYSALYIDANGEYVMFDEVGAGCLYRFWVTYQVPYTPEGYETNRICFYFDGETEPRMDLSIDEFFDGVGSPLEFPMVGRLSQSSHGYYCYLPFPYQERLKITLSGLPFFYQMTCHRFDSSDGVVSWTGSEDRSPVMAQWNTVGIDPKPTGSNVVVSGNGPVAAGATGTLFSAASAGVIQSIKLDPSPNSETILSNVWIQMNWDGGDLEVDVPLGDFFGSGKHEFNVTSLPIGMKTSGDWYCYFPMPYWESADIRLVNKGAEDLTALPFEVQYATNAYDRAKAGYFRARFSAESFVGNGRDFNFIDERGRGHVVGVSLFMESSGAGGYKDMAYLEGDERAHVDGALSPCIYGTGTEDYFNCGWYFNQGFFSRPYHGHPWHDHTNTDSPNYTQAYRFHLGDVIPFNQSVRFGVEHGHGNGSPGTYSSVTYYYKADGSSPGMVLAADLDLGDGWTESLYGYQFPAGMLALGNGWYYEGDDDDIQVVDDGYQYRGAIAEFTVPLIGDNAGLLLRRRTDQGVGGQKAHVFVDDAYAGIWYEADHNFASVDKRWLDSEFMVSSNLVAGKTSTRIAIVPLPSAPSWNEYRYWVYCIKPFSVVEDSDDDQLPDGWELEMVSDLGTLSGGADTDFDGFSDLSEYIAGTHPTNPASLFMIQANLAFQSEFGRLYHLQECTNLLSNDWQTIRSSIPGTGTLLEPPVETTNSAAFHRLQVEKP
ncbi:MAG: glycoside hydrolase family 172 protein [Verrucomicrobiota bacterium]